VSRFTDQNAEQVHAFSLAMDNLGLARVAELLLAMFQSGVWREFTDGTGKHSFLPGEFDYFLTQQGVTRDLVMHGVRDVGVKAQLEEAMDERRTGEEGYRRTLAEVRSAVPERPGRPIEPFGYTPAEAKHLREFGAEAKGSRQPLGRASRQYRISGGKTTRRPNEELSVLERTRKSVLRLSTSELQGLFEAISSELDSRSKG
jgi:hypothetical protein